MSEVKEEIIEPGIWKRANRHIVRLSGKYIGSYASLAAARQDLKNARHALIRTKSNTARDKLTKTKKDLTVLDLRMARNQLLSRGWS